MEKKLFDKISINFFFLVQLVILINIFNYARHILIAKYFGASALTDAYLVSAIIVLISIQLLSNSFATIIVPVFSELRQKSGFHGAWLYIRNLMTIVAIGSMGITILIFVFASVCVGILAPGFDEFQTTISTRLLKMFAPAVFFYSISGVLMGLLNGMGRFLLKDISELIGVAANFTLIILLRKHAGIYSLGYGLLCGSAIQCGLLMLFSFFNGFRYLPMVHLREQGFQRTLRLSAPILVGTITGFFAPVIDRIMASYLPAGSLSSLDYGNKIVQSFFLISVMPLSTILLTKFSTHYAKSQSEELLELYSNSCTILLYILAPIAFFLMFFAEPLITVLFERGAFDAEATTRTVLPVRIYAFWLFFAGLNNISGRLYYSMQKVIIPIIVGIAGVVLNVGLNLIFVRLLQHSGLALGTTLTSITKALVLSATLLYFFKTFSFKKLLKPHWQLGLIALFSGFVAFLSYVMYFNDLFVSSYLWTKLLILAALFIELQIIFIGISRLFRCEGYYRFFELVRSMLSLLKKKRIVDSKTIETSTHSI